MTKARIAGLDGVRGLAILLVLVAHALGPTGAGIAGVLVFFVLSGYLITSLLLAEHRRSGRIALGQFYLRRGVRLLPALVLFLAVLGAVSFLPWSGTSPREVGRGVVYALTYTTNLVVGFGFDLVPTTEHLWTLAVEEQFYLVWPIALIVILRRFPAGSRLPVIVRLYAVSVAVRVLVVMVSMRTGWYFYALPTTWGDALLAGCLLGVMAHERPDLVARVGRILLAGWARALGVLVLVAFALDPRTYWSPVTYVAVLPVLCLVAWQLVLAATTEYAPSWGRGLASRSARWLGVHSYALYLYNSAAILVAAAALGRTPVSISLALAAAVGLSVVSRVAVEKPAQAWRARRDRRLAVTPVAAPLADTAP